MKLGDKVYTPRFPVMSCMALERILNKSTVDIIRNNVQAQNDPPTFSFMIAIIWASLLHDNSEITINEVAALLDADGADSIITAYIEANKILVASVSRLLKVPKSNGDDKEKN